jgi:signal transduction histidine kinase/ActR/RegA family two-component response regulator
MISPSDILHGKILIVDDQKANIMLLEWMLNVAGYDSITSTMYPGEVCGMHAKNRYDLIVLDLQMPGMDGFQVMEALKKIEPDDYLPVLVITAQPSHRLRALKTGAKDFISKPFELADVQARVHNMLEVRLLHKKLHNYNDLLEQQVREQATLLAISHTLASTLELQPGLILDQLRELIAYTQGGLFKVEGPALVALATRGTLGFSTPEECRGRPGQEIQRPGQSAPLQIRLATPENVDALFNGYIPIRIADVWNDDDPQAQFLRSLLDDEAVVLLEGMQSWLWVPLAVKGRLVGGVGLASTTKNYFTAHHADLALSVADQSAITMVNAELYGQAQALAVLEERQSLARDLHDAVNQSLFSAGLIADVLPRLWEWDREGAKQSLQDLRRLIRGAVAEMRALLAELRPSTLTDASMNDLLQLLGNAFSGRTNVPAAVTVTGEFSLPADVQVAFYRVCQEALNNIAKHAKASHVEVDLKHDGAVIALRICDDGQGFDMAQTFAGHYGLGMMRERAEAAGALLTVASQPAQGTALTLRWPIPAYIPQDASLRDSLINQNMSP